jgi:hypothetical protein
MRWNQPMWVTVVAACVVTACSSDSSPSLGDTSNTPVVVASERKLKQIGSPDAFYDALREALIAQNKQDYAYPGGPVALEVDVDAASAPPAPTAESAADSTGTANSSSAGDNSGTGDGSGRDFTDTNVQEIGVDEADLVKTDGEFLYVLKRVYNDFGPVPEPLPLPGIVEEPTDDTASAQLRLSLPAPLNQSTSLRILGLDASTPNASVLAEVAVDTKGMTTSGMYLHKTDQGSSIVMTASGSSGFYDIWGSSYGFNGSESLITSVDVTNPGLSAVSNQVLLDGQIISSRRIGNQLFFASRYYPAIPGVNPYSVGADEWKSIVESTDLSTVLPQFSSTGSSTDTALVDPGDCFVASKPDNAYYTPDIISLVTVNLDTMTVSDSVCYLGSTETLYASPNSVYLATTQWSYETFDEGVTGDSTTEVVDPDERPTTSGNDIAPTDPRVDTDIHQFAIGEGTLTYQGSGTVAGHLGWNYTRMPHRLSEYQGRLRVVSHSATQNANVSPVNVTVLEPNGAGELATVAQLPNSTNPEPIGKPFEDLYASKFLGDKAYLVTFRRTDPLYVIDFSSPTNPYVAGELEIDGYSEYLQPVGEGYLLGIGKDAFATQDGTGALPQGVKLSLFDVRDASNPTEVQSVVIGQRGTESSALYDHRGITVQMANDNHPTRVAIGISVNGVVEPPPVNESNAFEWYPSNYTGLHGFDIQTGADAGIVFRGALAAQTDQYGYNSSYNDRSVIVNDAAFYINDAQVYFAPWDDLANGLGPR